MSWLRRPGSTAVATLAMVVAVSGASCATARGDGGAAGSTTAAGPEQGQGFSSTKVSYEEAVAAIDGPIEFPLRMVTLTTAETRLLNRANWVLRQACLAQDGFTEPPFAAEPPPELDDVEWERRYLYIRLSDASELGYRGSTIADQAYLEYLDTFEAHHQSMPAEQREAWFTRYEACSAEAEAQLCGDLRSPAQAPYCQRRFDIANEDMNLSWAVARASGAVHTAMRRWSDCMDRNDHHFDDIDAAWEAGVDIDDRQASIAMAVDDTTCKDESKLMHVWATVEGGVQAEIIEKNPERYHNVAEQKHELMRRAADAIESAGSRSG